MRALRFLAILTALVLAASGTFVLSPGHDSAAAADCVPNPATPKRQLRAMWISSVANIDWPSEQGLTVAEQQAEYRARLDQAVSRRLNAVVVQIRPTADALWPSPHEPWSQWLTGTQGKNPGYDPLAFLVAEAHARDLEFHAWFNPYRVAMHDDPSKLVAAHPARQHPDWTFAYGGKLYYNPGIPEVRAFVQTAMMDAVTRYDIDGVHWDDYFYPYPVSGVQIPDQQTFQRYGAGFGNIQDWRRNNVNLLVQEMRQKVQAVKPHVKFGVSPFGIWRNQSTDALGSKTTGLQSYDAIYADSRRWVKQNWIDYITPQIYWHIGYSAADYGVLVAWWSSVVQGTQVQLFVGQGVYKLGASGQPAEWQDPNELSDHLRLNRTHPQVLGDIHFSAKDLKADRLGGVGVMAAEHYSRPAIVPVAAHLGGAAPPTPSLTSAVRGTSGVTLSWRAASGASPTSYAVYRVAGSGPAGACDFADAGNLLATVRAAGTTGSYVDKTAAATATYTYYVTALDRLHHESAVGAGATVPGSGTPASVIVDNATSGAFSAGANWGASSWSAQKYGADYRYASPYTGGSDVAWFRAGLSATGSYRVEVWYPADAGYNSATPFIVATSTGNQSVTVDQRVNGGRWLTLGTFTLNAGDRNIVGVSRWTSTTGYVVADAVRLTRV
ncbi:family 10 glycosylhydrolase [Phytomonospora sp. NPDC050363]|uniref:family 10 glycosylhydrolase n=1 Tax=Phytomonospora sp. NPDC050363 TaxID=3155642 RepID=UPI0034012730